MAQTPKKKQSGPLSAKWKRFIERGVRAGRFRSEQDAMDRALKLLEQRERDVQLFASDIRRKIDEGIAEADRGELIDAKTAFDHLRSGRERVRARRSA